HPFLSPPVTMIPTERFRGRRFGESAAPVVRFPSVSIEWHFKMALRRTRRDSASPVGPWAKAFPYSPAQVPKTVIRELPSGRKGIDSRVIALRQGLFIDKQYGIRTLGKYWNEGITHLSWLHELRFVEMARMGLRRGGVDPIFSAGNRRRNQF